MDVERLVDPRDRILVRVRRQIGLVGCFRAKSDHSLAVWGLLLNGLVLTPNANYHGTIYLSVMAQDTTTTSYYGQTSASVPVKDTV